MDKLSTKILIFILCAVLCFGSVVTVIAVTGDDDAEDTQENAPVATVADTSDEELAKDETVYVLAGADGSIQKIIVSDWIKNAISSAYIDDVSALTDIENVKGDETYTVNGDAKVWDAEGNDIYYRGNIEKELPVGLSVSYKLDGKSISADELAGKSGKVTIRFDYDNRQYEMVEIDGTHEKIYIPFAMLTGTLLDSAKFRNVEVSNGKLLNDGEHTAVIGIAFPGLQEDLALERGKVDIPDYVEITADVTDFSLGITVTVATNEVFNSIDIDRLESVEGLTDSIGAMSGEMQQLSDGMKQLLDGSSALYDGLCTLLEKSNELVSGIDLLLDGSKKLNDGASALDDGVNQLSSGSNELLSGLNTLKDNNSALNDGAKQIFETLLATAEAQIKANDISIPKLTMKNYAEVLDGVIGSLDTTSIYNQAVQQVTDAVNANHGLIVEEVTKAVRNEVEAQVTEVVKEKVSEAVTAAVYEEVEDQVIRAAASMSPENFYAAVKAGVVPKATQTAVEAKIQTQMMSNEVKAIIYENTMAQLATPEIRATIIENTNEQMKTSEVKKAIDENVEIQSKKAISDNMASDEVQSKLAAASDGVQTLISLRTSLDGLNSFYIGLQTYTDGVATAAAGAKTLASGVSDLKVGTTQLKSGAASLYDGILQVKNNVPALTDGVTQLRDGAMQLSDGLKEFNEKGISKILEIADVNLDGLLTRIKITVNVSKKYRNFSGIGDGMDGQVKFIYRTEEIG